MAPRYHVDLSRFPIVRTTLSDGMDLGRFEQMLVEYYDAVIARGEPYVSVIDARDLHAIPGAKVRKVIADQRRRAMERGVDRLMLGYAAITSNRFLRSTIAVIDWVSPIAGTWTIVETPEEAITWAESVLARSETTRA